jgi:hypothetical protein
VSIGPGVVGEPDPFGGRSDPSSLTRISQSTLAVRALAEVVRADSISLRRLGPASCSSAGGRLNRQVDGGGDRHQDHFAALFLQRPHDDCLDSGRPSGVLAQFACGPFALRSGAWFAPPGPTGSYEYVGVRNPNARKAVNANHVIREACASACARVAPSLELTRRR